MKTASASHSASCRVLHGRWKIIWHRHAPQITLAMVGGVVLFGIATFIVLAGHVHRGSTLSWDEAILRGLRRSDNLSVPIGPHWLSEFALDATALGSPLVLTFFVAASLGFIYFEGQKRVAALTAATTGLGAALSYLLKQYFLRPRPDIVPHLRDVTSSSFPSGHSMGAAVVYLTLGVMFMKSFASRRAKAYCLFWALFLTLIVGVSRVLLGVHYPSDVLGGWLAGMAWALVCWSAGWFVPNHPLPEINDAPRPRSDL